MTWQVWIRLNPYQTTQVIINANSGWECKAIAEAQYGHGNVLNYTQLNG